MTVDAIGGGGVPELTVLAAALVEAVEPVVEEQR